MKEAKEIILAFYDGDEEYASQMTEYMERQKNLPWSIHTYTELNKLIEQEKGVNILLVAESVYCEELKELQPERLVVLNESGIIRDKNLRYINKYQQADQVVKDLLVFYLEIVPQVLPRFGPEGNSIFIGFFSPVRRSYQTTLALTMAQLLSGVHRTLYLNFEYFAGAQELVPDIETRDLADLLYFLNADKETFSLRMQSMVKQIGMLDYVPPMKYGQNLLSVTAKEWIQFIRKLQEIGSYEFILMDLSECMQGLFDILRSCHRIYTVTGEDKVGADKLLQYEKLVEQYSYDDILSKTIRCQIPRFRHLPIGLEYYTRGEMAEYAKTQISEFLKLDGEENSDGN